MEKYKINFDEHRLSCVQELKDKLKPEISEKKQRYMNFIKEKTDLSSEEFEKCCFEVTALCEFEKFINSPWAFLEISECNAYILPTEDLEMMVSNSEFDSIDKYLFLCVDEKAIVSISDRLFQENLIDALDMVVYKKKYRPKEKELNTV